MLPKWKMPKGKYVLKTRNRNTYFLKAGSHDDGRSESPASAQTTMNRMSAFGFPTFKRADAMRELLNQRYGLETQVIERMVRRDDG